MDFFLESPFMPNRVKLDRETLGGLADMFGQMPGADFVPGFCVLDSLSFSFFCSDAEAVTLNKIFLFLLLGLKIHRHPLLSSQAVGLEPARGLFRTGIHPLWDAIAPTRSSTATAATSPLHHSHSLTWGQSPL